MAKVHNPSRQDYHTLVCKKTGKILEVIPIQEYIEDCKIQDTLDRYGISIMFTNSKYALYYHLGPMPPAMRVLYGI